MCTKSDNSCREEKLGCEGCYYNYNETKLYPIFEYLIDTLVFAIKFNIVAQLHIKKEEHKNILYEIINICKASTGILKYSNRGNSINVYRYGKKILKIKERN